MTMKTIRAKRLATLFFMCRSAMNLTVGESLSGSDSNDLCSEMFDGTD
jgi:hypothetical protein